MKKHNLMRAASAMAVAILLSTGVIGGSLAKYISTAVSETGTAKVATWLIKAGTNASNLTTISVASGSPKFQFDLFNTEIRDSKTTNLEQNVKKSTTDSVIIAPGTWGYTDLTIENASEVKAAYTIKVQPDSAGLPLEYAIMKRTDYDTETNLASIASDGLNVDWSGQVPEGGFEIASTDREALNMENGKAIYRVYWKWNFERGTDAGTKETNDNTDTKLGIEHKAMPTVIATVTATQID